MSKTDIQAVVFDFGGVLLDWNPRYLYRPFFPENPQAMEDFFLEVGFHEWNLSLDKGRPFAEAVPELSAQFPHHSELIRAFDERWHHCIGGRIEGTIDILRTLKEAGTHSLYGLSNWSAETFYRIRPDYEFFDWFDFIVLSGEVKLIKPDPAIFQYLLDQTGQPAEACVFIDDMAYNVEAAQQLGIRGIQFTSPEQLAADLRVAVHLQVLEMILHQLAFQLEIVALGQFGIALDGVQLKQQAFLEVAGADAGGFQSLDQAQGGFEVLRGKRGLPLFLDHL